MSLNLVVSSAEGSWILSVIYNSQVISYHRLLWRTLAGVNNIHLPWLLAGDFNAVLSVHDFKGGTSNSYDYKSRLFSNFVNSANLLDLGFVGSRFTWCNNQVGLSCRWARLDRFLANHDWIASFSSLENLHLPRSCSDHCPLLLTACTHTPSKSSIFQFDNIWFEYSSCHNIISNAFQVISSSSHMHSLHHCLHRAKNDLIKWHISGTRSIDAELSHVEMEIKNVEDSECFCPRPVASHFGSIVCVIIIMPSFVKTPFIGLRGLE
ncbi:uncharacterized protein LOC120267217 [Dioscorea cayenensis subsp. rotundata]|uniref:Uncharacterized protein LOC120267217 n=1 Tax=Dioscorea cayennensis subsp. rotundata TaxID=55577 RepID=A0AB40BV73_DIOCR|nr:uncharacterized protein LOC120267217 [Dioscorea cayenensis subsp. rotundata]